MTVKNLYKVLVSVFAAVEKGVSHLFFPKQHGGGLLLTAMLAAAAPVQAVLLASCEQQTDAPKQFKGPKEFKIDLTNGFDGKSITIKDGRTGLTFEDKNLEELGVIDKFKDGFDTYFTYENIPVLKRIDFNNVLYRGITIIVENPDISYDGRNTIDAKTITFDINYINNVDIMYLICEVDCAIVLDLYNMAKANNSFEKKLASLGKELDNSKETLRLSRERFKFRGLDHAGVSVTFLAAPYSPFPLYKEI
jgi:hypothetical protein